MTDDEENENVNTNLRCKLTSDENLVVLLKMYYYWSGKN